MSMQYEWLIIPYIDPDKLKKLGEMMTEGSSVGYHVHSWQHNKDGGITVLMVLPEENRPPGPIEMLSQRRGKPMADPDGRAIQDGKPFVATDKNNR